MTWPLVIHNAIALLATVALTLGLWCFGAHTWSLLGLACLLAIGWPDRDNPSHGASE